MKEERNTFNINMGDTIYSDTEVGGGRRPRDDRRGEVGQVPPEPRAATWSTLRGSAGMYNHWDDHEFINDFTTPSTATRSTTPASRRSATTCRSPTREQNGIYRSFRWGKNLQVFFLDERSFRSAKASADHVR